MSGLRVIAGASFPRDGESALHGLARALRAGDPAAVAPVASILAAGLTREAPELDVAGSVVVVPMAGHLVGTLSGRAAELAEGLVARHPGWTLAAGPERVSDAPAAMTAESRQPLAEAGTLRWPGIPGDVPVLLVDDVVRTGASLEAAWLAAPPELRVRLSAVTAFRALE